jgi:MYXO-CTERM domain-containing protein
MKIFLNVFGVLLVLMGTTWFLQGASVLTAGSSPMIGDPHWEYYGALAVLVGLALIVVARRRGRAKS